MIDGDEIRIGCVLPVLQSTALFIFIGGFVTCIGLTWRPAWLDLASVAGAVGTFGGCCWLITVLCDWRQMALSQSRSMTTITQTTAGDDRRQVSKVRVEVISDGGRQGDYLDLPEGFSVELMADVCQRLLRSGASFSMGYLSGNGKPLSRSEFELLRDLFIGRGLAVWNNARSKNQGVTLTAPGRAVVKRFAEWSPAEEVIDG